MDNNTNICFVRAFPPALDASRSPSQTIRHSITSPWLDGELNAPLWRDERSTLLERKLSQDFRGLARERRRRGRHLGNKRACVLNMLRYAGGLELIAALMGETRSDSKWRVSTGTFI